MKKRAGRVMFTGAVAHERVAKLLDACDILVAPHVPLADGSEFFGSPTKIFEYMAMGKGIVASRLGRSARCWLTVRRRCWSSREMLAN